MLARILSYPLFLLYDLLTRLLSPLIRLHVHNRIVKGKEDHLRYKERFGKTSLKRPKGKLLWIHGASVGESLSVLPLINKIAAEYPHLIILVTTGTQTSAALMQQKLPKHAIHQYAPFDVGSWVDSFLSHWQPDLVFWLEAEFWPNMILKARRRGAELIHLNTRISDNSFQKWCRLRFLICIMLRCFSLSLPQTQSDKNKLEFLGAKTLKLLGNLKFSSPPLPVDQAALDDLKTQVGGRLVWLAASTHMEEEELAFQVHAQLSEKYPTLLTIIAPRHPIRAPQFASTFIDRGFETALRSAKEKIQSTTSFYVADTLGELGIFFALCPIVMVGGSFVNVGGHNIIEPAHFKCAILHGIHMEKNAEMAQLFQEKNAAIQVDSSMLADAVETLFKSSDRMEELQKNAYEIAQSQLKILDSYYAEVSIFLERIQA